jgi:hypothetical protein
VALNYCAWLATARPCTDRNRHRFRTRRPRPTGIDSAPAGIGPSPGLARRPRPWHRPPVGDDAPVRAAPGLRAGVCLEAGASVRAEAGTRVRTRSRGPCRLGARVRICRTFGERAARIGGRAASAEARDANASRGQMKASMGRAFCDASRAQRHDSSAPHDEPEIRYQTRGECQLHRNAGGDCLPVGTQRYGRNSQRRRWPGPSSGLGIRT